MVDGLRLFEIPGSSKIHEGVTIRTYTLPPMRAFELSGDFEPAKRAVCDPVGWANAIGMLEAVAQGKRSDGFAKALYFIGVEQEPEIAKIGISANPILRLNDLQGAHYRRLFLHAICFAPTRKAKAIEQEVLKSKDRLQGEWLGVSPDALLNRAFEVSEKRDWYLSDGATWFTDMANRTKHLAKMKRRKKHCA